MSFYPEQRSSSWEERVKLALLATSGSLFAYLSPSIVSALISEFGSSGYDAGLVVSANIIGTGAGGFLAVLLSRRSNWRAICGVALLIMATADVCSTYATLHQSFLAIRFLHGTAAGTLLGLTFAAMARRSRPERTLAIYLFLQLSIAGGVMLVGESPAIELVGADAYWAALGLVSVLAMPILAVISTAPVPLQRKSQTPPKRAGLTIVAMMMLGIVVYQTGEVAVYAFVIELGLNRGFQISNASNAVAASLLLGAPVALVATWRAHKGSYQAPTVLSTLAMAIAISVFLLPSYEAYITANVLFSVFFCMSCAYMFGVAAKLDNIGQVAATASFASTIGESLGPVLGGMIIDQASYLVLITIGMGAVILAAALFVRPSRDAERVLFL